MSAAADASVMAFLPCVRSACMLVMNSSSRMTANPLASMTFLNLSAGSTSAAQIASCLAIPHDLLVQRYPPNLAALST